MFSKIKNSALTILIIGAASSFAQATEYKAGELIVKYKDSATRTHQTMNALYDAAGVRNVKRYSPLMGNMEHVILSDNIKMQDAIAAFQHDPVVEFVHPNFIVRAFPTYHIEAGMPCIPGLQIPNCDPAGGAPGGGGGGAGGCLIPGIPFPPGCDTNGNPGHPEEPGQPASRPVVAATPAEVIPAVADADLAKAYGLAKIGATEAWKTHRGSKKFIVADIDTGIDYNHEDLSFNIWRNPNPSAKGDVVGYDFTHDDGLPFDDNGHGTHTAGTIGAVGGNGIGVSGVIQQVSIMSLKFLTGAGSGTTADAIKAIDYAVNHGAKVLSNSWGGYGDDNNKGLAEAITRARDKDVLFIAAAGNGDQFGSPVDNDGSNPSFPSSLNVDNIISVAATDSGDNIAVFSNYGKTKVHLAAPGVGVYSTIPKGANFGGEVQTGGALYYSLDGTSMACPHVAGAAALLWSAHPEMTYKQVKATLMNSVDKVASLEGKTITGGRLNILKALRSKE